MAARRSDEAVTAPVVSADYLAASAFPVVVPLLTSIALLPSARVPNIWYLYRDLIRLFGLGRPDTQNSNMQTLPAGLSPGLATTRNCGSCGGGLAPGFVRVFQLTSRTTVRPCGLAYPRVPAARDSVGWSQFDPETRPPPYLWCARRMKDLAHVLRRSSPSRCREQAANDRRLSFCRNLQL